MNTERTLPQSEKDHLENNNKTQQFIIPILNPADGLQVATEDNYLEDFYIKEERILSNLS